MHELFSYRIDTQDISFKHARGASDRSGKEFHVYHEVILFWDGDAEFISEDLHMSVRPNTLIVIPKETYHQMVIHGDRERYYRSVLQFGDREGYAPLTQAGLQGVLTMQADQEMIYLFKKLAYQAQNNTPRKEQILQAVLVLLLDSVLSGKTSSDERTSQNELVRDALEYINRNLGQALTVSQIAQACSTSPSSLAHTFRKEMYCSVYKFITKKRLISAYHRIAAGQAPTVVALECGFQEYSGFYKQYKKMFGAPPSQVRERAKAAR